MELERNFALDGGCRAWGSGVLGSRVQSVELKIAGLGFGFIRAGVEESRDCGEMPSDSIQTYHKISIT